MSVYEKIKAILQSYGYPIEADEYGGGADRYFIVMIDTVPANFSDDAPGHERCSVMVHFVAPKSDDISTNVSQIKTALSANGFTWPSVTPAGDSSKWRQIFECEYAEGV